MKFNIKHIFAVACLCLIAQAASAAGLTFSGNTKKVISEKPEASTGLNEIYVLFSTEGVKASFTAQNSKVVWYKYTNYGGAYAEEISAGKNGKTYTIDLGADDVGYIIEDGTTRYYYWVVNYANHYAHLDQLLFDGEQECDRARLKLIGDAKKITYFTINGKACELSRQLLIQYNSLEYDEESEIYVQKAVEHELPSIDGSFGVAAPLCDTDFTLTGDRFLKDWGEAASVTSAYYDAIAVEAKTSATQEMREYDNEQKVETEGLGGSAPVYIKFSASVTDAAIFREWQLSRDAEFEVVDDRYQQLDFEYTFHENGITYVRFVANNAIGSCEFVSETYQVQIGESAILCPNAFSPGTSEGVNDIWKVSYKSIVSFECHIFNRWGQQMTSFTDPGQGWDGKYKGKLVPAGVYYYVIKAVGADGRKYNLSGDINIIKTKISGYGGGTSSEDTPSGDTPAEDTPAED